MLSKNLVNKSLPKQLEVSKEEIYNIQIADLQQVPQLTHKSGKIVHFPIIMNFESSSISKFKMPTSVNKDATNNTPTDSLFIMDANNIRF